VLLNGPTVEPKACVSGFARIPEHISRTTMTRWRYLYRVLDRDGALIDVMLSEHRDLAAARAFFRSAKAVTGVTPGQVTTDGHDAYPRAIRTELGKHVQHRTSRYLNNRVEQEHRGIKSRCRPMLGLTSTVSPARYCRGYDELRKFLRCRSPML
jgi:putative transposase